MYDIKVIRKSKKQNILVNYINILDIFSKNLWGELSKFMSKIFFYTKNTRGWEDF